MALLALACIPGFIALARVENDRSSSVESVSAVGAARSLGADGSSTLLSTSSSVPEGCVPVLYNPCGILLSGIQQTVPTNVE